MESAGSAVPVSRYSGMSPKSKRIWGIGLIVFFVIMVGMIAWSEWYAYNVNVPAYEHAHGAKKP
ncbi:MAG TPA: hypothetical protein VFL13_01175 [Candidatus Baltobacteraceae bacterium]|nr:hypothetical protein [Candidatus Baltobacteraceae bacterium]